MIKKHLAENFDHDRRFGLHNLPIAERLQSFQNILRTDTTAENSLYRRELVGPADHRIVIADGIAERSMLMFGSNNYLGFANHPEIVERTKRWIDRWGVGVAGPALLNGTTSLHREVCERLSVFKQKQTTLLFPSGYQANLAWITALPKEGDILVNDELAHASLEDGMAMLLSRRKIAQFRFRHNDSKHLRSLLDRIGRKRSLAQVDIYVYVEGVYSMEGDLAPLDLIVPICKEHKVFLVVDDAHGTGVVGPHGRGVPALFGVDEDVDLLLGTFSKTFTTTGGFLSGDRELIEYLSFFARPYIFTAHLPPPTLATVLACLDLLERDESRVLQLRANVEYLMKGLANIGLSSSNDGSAIVPVLVPGSIDIGDVTADLHRRGIFVNAVVYPAVPKNLQRLRMSVMATHTRAEIDELLAVLRPHALTWQGAKN